MPIIQLSGVWLERYTVYLPGETCYCWCYVAFFVYCKSLSRSPHYFLLPCSTVSSFPSLLSWRYCRWCRNSWNGKFLMWLTYCINILLTASAGFTMYSNHWHPTGKPLDPWMGCIDWTGKLNCNKSEEEIYKSVPIKLNLILTL